MTAQALISALESIPDKTAEVLITVRNDQNELVCYDLDSFNAFPEDKRVELGSLELMEEHGNEQEPDTGSN